MGEKLVSLGKAAAHVLEEVCKRIGYCDRDAERWNDFHYVTKGSENLREEAYKLP